MMPTQANHNSQPSNSAHADHDSQPSANHNSQPSNSAQDASAQQRPRIDLMAQARSTQRHDEAMRGSAGSVKLIAPAKVNLALGIGALRADGFHDALNIMHAVMLHDVLHMKQAPGAQGSEGLTVRVDTSSREGIAPLDIPAEANIAYKAVVMLAEQLARTQHETIELYIEKHIPFQAGLGGGSSDAAAALVGAASLWGIAPDHPALEEVAQKLGSDVAFFLHGGCACFGGRGELFERTLTPMKKTVVLIKPDDGVSTAAAYRAFDENPQPIEAAVQQAAQSAVHAQDVPLFNNLATASENLLPVLADVRTWAQSQPSVEDVLLCGSGSATFAVCSDFDAACNLAVTARQQGWWARATAFSSAKAALVPRR